MSYRRGGPGQASGYRRSRESVETLTTRATLAAAHFADGRRAEAIPLLQRTLADSERFLGPDHSLTRTVHDNLEAARRT